MALRVRVISKRTKPNTLGTEPSVARADTTNARVASSDPRVGPINARVDLAALELTERR